MGCGRDPVRGRFRSATGLNRGMAGRRKGGPPRGPDAVRVTRWLRAAFEAHGAGKLREAERLARRVLEAIPDQPDAQHLLATVARESGRTDLAIDLYERLLRRHPAIPIAQNNLGNLLQERREWQRAIACYEAALAHDPRYMSAYFNLGRALLETNDSPRAESFLRQAAALAPDDAQIRSHLARALVEQGKREEALEEVRRAIKLDPDSTDLQSDAGVVHGTIGEFDTAREHYRSALALDPTNARAALNLAKSKRFTAQDDEDANLIYAAFRRAATSSSAQRDLHLALGKIYDDRGEWESAFSHYEQANRPFSATALRQVDDSLALMDRMCAVFDSDWFAARPTPISPDPTPVFIVGMPRSGTTLVEQLLAAHPELHGAGELSGILRLAAEVAAHAGVNVDPLRTGVVSMNAALRAGTDAAYPECVRAFAPEQFVDFGERYLKRLRIHSSEAARISDKLPGNYLHLGFIATILPGAKIIYCRRDPLDIAISIYFTDFMAEHQYSNDLRAIGHLIRGMRALMVHWESVLGKRILTVDYEALVADPEPVIRAMVAHVDLAWDDACLRHHKVPRPVHTASAWQVRQPVYKHSVGRARHYNRFLGPLREALGDAATGKSGPV